MPIFIAVEQQPVNQLQTQTLNEKDPPTLSQAIVVPARHED
jgi:hypothetical protein